MLSSGHHYGDDDDDDDGDDDGDDDDDDDDDDDCLPSLKTWRHLCGGLFMKRGVRVGASRANW